MDFKELSLNEDLMKGIEESGYVSCTKVQEEVLKNSLEKTDLYVQSQTGTGKTAAYLISIFQHMSLEQENAKKALILVPTRELAVQVEEEAKTLAGFTKFRCASFYGGVGYEKQYRQLEKGVDVIIGTPGRIIDLQESKKMDLSNVGYLVVDEADRMFDMGFYPELRTIVKFVPETSKRITMLFSATLNTYVKNLAWEYTDDAKEITIDCDQITVTDIDQKVFHVSSDKKINLLLKILSESSSESTIIFCNTKRMTEVLSKRLALNGIKSEFLIGDLPQKKRLQIIKSFKEKSLKCLVATDVAARGIDVDDLGLVINFDLPAEVENYVHRIGRTARAGKSGCAYSFCSEQDVYNLPLIEKYIEMQIPSVVASEDNFTEDKSEGTYIKLDHYESDGMRGKDGRQKGRDNRNGASKYKKEHSGRSDVRTERKRPPKKSDGNNENRKTKPSVDLSTLTFEDRMKFYKEKYAKDAPVVQNKKKGNRKPVPQKAAPAKKNDSKAKKGFFAKIKALFSKK